MLKPQSIPPIPDNPHMETKEGYPTMEIVKRVEEVTKKMVKGEMI